MKLLQKIKIDKRPCSYNEMYQPGKLKNPKAFEFEIAMRKFKTNPTYQSKRMFIDVDLHISRVTVSDIDNFGTKNLFDSLTKAKIFEDDRFIYHFNLSKEKLKKDEKDYVIIKIYELEENEKIIGISSIEYEEFLIWKLEKSVI